MAAKLSLVLRKDAALNRINDTVAHLEESGPKLLASLDRIEKNLKVKVKVGTTVLDRLAAIEKLTASQASA